MEDSSPKQLKEFNLHDSELESGGHAAHLVSSSVGEGGQGSKVVNTAQSPEKKIHDEQIAVNHLTTSPIRVQTNINKA